MDFAVYEGGQDSRHRVILYYLHFLEIANIPLILACFYYSTRLPRLCLIALWVNALALAFFILPILSLVGAINPPHDSKAAIQILLRFSIPLAVEFLALLAVYRWRWHVARN